MSNRSDPGSVTLATAVAHSLERTIQTGSVVSGVVRDELNPVPKWLGAAGIAAVLLVARGAYRRWRSKGAVAH